MINIAMLLKLVTTLFKISAIFSAHGSNRHYNPVHSLRYAEWRRGSRSWTVTVNTSTKNGISPLILARGSKMTQTINLILKAKHVSLQNIKRIR